MEDNKCCEKCLNCPDYPDSGGHNYCHNKSCPCHSVEKESVYKIIEPKMNEIKARYPENTNIEGLEPALTSDVAEVCIWYADLKLKADRQAVREEIEHNIKDCLKLMPEMSLDTYIRGSTLFSDDKE